MIDLNTLLIFTPIALALNLTPGAEHAVLSWAGREIGAKGRGGGVAWIATGGFIHALASGLGLAALIAANPLTFEIIRWAGVGYLLYLAFKALTSPVETLKPGDLDQSSNWRAWQEGVLVCLLNPKVAIFMLALVPQFVDPGKGSILAQFLILGGALNIGGTIINALIGVFAGGIGRFLARNARAARSLQYLTGFVFVGLAAKLAFDRR